MTSDIYDLAEVIRSRHEDWSWTEHLLGGAVLHGSVWPGDAPALRLLERAVEICGLKEDLEYANYRLLGQPRNKTVKSRSLPNLVAKHSGRVRTLNYNGVRATAGARDGVVSVSCSVFSPLDEGLMCVVVAPGLFGPQARSLLAEASGMVGAEYGYAFVRDAVAGPEQYALGMGVSLDYSDLEGAELAESDSWARLVLSESWRAQAFPLRDLFEVNLLTGSQLDRDLGAGESLRDWIVGCDGRGALEAVGGGRFIWLLTERDISAIRPDLARMGVIVGSLPRVYRGLGQSPGIALSATTYSASRH